jgi:hypothetical protein
MKKVALLTFVIGCLSASEFGLFGNVADIKLTLRLRGGTGQGGPSKGFRSNGKSFKWRHPMTMFGRSHAHRRPSTVSHFTFTFSYMQSFVYFEFPTGLRGFQMYPYVTPSTIVVRGNAPSRPLPLSNCELIILFVFRLSNTRRRNTLTPKTSESTTQQSAHTKLKPDAWNT